MKKARTFHCPICRKAVERTAAEFPFCSPRCKQIDLGKWAGESYRIPGEPAVIPEDDNTDSD